MSARILVVDDSPTIRKVVASILSTRSFEPVLAADGQEALELLSEHKIDLILLDFVMPRMNGYQFCRELRANAEHKSVPVVLMSAKGDRVRDQFVQQTGAVDAIAKPFDARGLIAVVEGALKKQEEGRLRPVPDANAMPAESGETERPSRGVNDDPATRRLHATSEFVMLLGRLLVPELERSLENFDTPGFSDAVARAVRPESLEQFLAPLQTLNNGAGSREVLAGDISVISIAEVLQMLGLQRQTGALAVSDRRQVITLYIHHGNLDWAASTGLGDEFLLGRYLMEAGTLNRDQLERALEARTGPKRLLGDALRAAGVVRPEDIRQALVRQSSELLYEVVRWKRGRFAFNIGVEHPIATEAGLDLETGSLVMEGFRRVDEWRLIEGSFDFDEVLYPDRVAIERLGSEGNLTVQERSVLHAIDGARTIREIVGNMTGSSFDLCKIVYQFLNSRLVRRKAA
jgi:DNA-binding response OmpR family regulator